MNKFAAVLADVISVVVFVAVGRSVHGHGDTIAGIFRTAAPFLVGVVAGWLVVRSWGSPSALWPTGVVVWIATVSIGQSLRLVVGQGSAIPFVLVSLGFFALTMLGWRAVLLGIRPLRVHLNASRRPL